MAAILSVREMINSAFGAIDENIVNFNMVQSVLHVLAQQLRVLERRVELRGDITSNSNITVTELKLQSGKKVERGSATDIGQSQAQGHSYGRISVVTQSQFAELESLVHDIKNNVLTSSNLRDLIPSNEETIDQIRQGNLSLPDAMVTLKFAARIEATEQAIDKIMGLIEELAASMSSEPQRLARKDDSVAEKNLSEMSVKSVGQKERDYREKVSKIGAAQRLSTTRSSATEGLIKEEQLTKAIMDLENKIEMSATAAERMIKTSINTTMNKVNSIEERMEELKQIEQRNMSTLEHNINECTNQINSFDAGVSSQLTSFQDQLNELQADLEAGLQQAMETAAAGGDTAAMEEVKIKLKLFTTESEASAASIFALNNDIKCIDKDLNGMQAEIEILKEVKVDREEMLDSIRDKADKHALNGMVSIAYFEAVRDHIEGDQNIAAEKFRKCELVWQKVIDDVHAELEEKVDTTQLEPLREYMDGRLVDVWRRIEDLRRAVGEPRAAGVTRRVMRGADCIACSAPAVLQEERDALPRMRDATVRGVRPPPPPPPPAADKQQPREIVCYADWPTGTRPCHRYCGGSHTVVLPGVVTRSQVPDTLTVSSIPRHTVPVQGSDGQLYKTEEILVKRPCTPCNVPSRSRHHHQVDDVQVQTSADADICACSVDADAGVSVYISSKDATPHSSKAFGADFSLPVLSANRVLSSS